MSYTSAAEDAAKIRAEYKNRGWNSRKVSVRCENFSMGSAVNVEIKTPEVDTKEAERIATDVAERIRRCEITGEILGGGNRYVHVGHSHECREIMARRWSGQIEEALRSLDPARRDVHASIPGTRTDASITRTLGDGAQIWMKGRAGLHFHPECGVTSAAFSLALEEDAAAKSQR